MNESYLEQILELQNVGHRVPENENLYSSMIQSINISIDLTRQEMPELGRRGPYCRNVEFPIEITEEIKLLQCYDCGLKYDECGDCVIDDETWEKINPSSIKGGGLLCANCIIKRLRKAGICEVDAKLYINP